VAPEVVQEYRGTGVIQGYRSTGIVQVYIGTCVVQGYKVPGVVQRYTGMVVVHCYPGPGIIILSTETGVLQGQTCTRLVQVYGSSTALKGSRHSTGYSSTTGVQK
jgi:hypothetical protein